MKKPYFSRENRGRTVAFVLFFLYLALVLRLTVFRDGMLQKGWFCGQIYYQFFRSYVPMVRAHKWGTFLYLFGGNIGWFLPFGFFLRYATKWKWGTITAAGFLFSLFIETMQFVFGTGISELDDLILNTLGVVVGASMCGMARKIAQRVREKKGESQFFPKG